MANLYLQYRHRRTHRREKTQQIVVFQMQREWFALPIFAVKKVVPRSQTYGEYHNSGAGLTVYQGRELLVLDVEHQVFGGSHAVENPPNSQPVASTPPLSPDPIPSSPLPQDKAGYLLIMRNRQEEWVGLPISAPPTVRRISRSAFAPLPASYTARVNIQCVSALIVQAEHQSLIFLLNPDQLLQVQNLLPPIL